MAKVKKEKKSETLPITLTDTHGNVTANYTAEMVDTIKNTVATNATDSELMMFLSVANKYDLDPFLGEIYFVKYDTKSQIVSSRDGYRKIAKRQPNFLKCQSMEVCANDTFKTTMEMGEVTNITHEFSQNDRGAIVGAYAILKTTDGQSYYTYVDIKEYDTRQNAWRKYKSAMIKKVAETQLYKQFADINGIQPEEAMPKGYDFDNNTNLPSDEEMLDVEIVEEPEAPYNEETDTE